MEYRESKTKIIATLGPASSDKDILRKMFIAGVDVCRINFSHGTHKQHLETIGIIRELNKELGLNVAILTDLQGPKLRIGEIESNEIELRQGENISIVTKKCLGTKEKIYMSYKKFPEEVAEGDTVLIDDGKIKLEVINTNKKDTVNAKIVFGGLLSSRKGVNLPKTKISQPSLTEKDIADANFALDNNVDWIALSFVRSFKDILALKELIKQRKNHAFVIAKIEKPEALNEIDKIIEVSDGIMVARGDLGVEVEFHRVPLIQKEIVGKCILNSTPVIIATQMLESMINNFRPTRAEASDIANAVIEGADTLMLSGETSVGKFPVKVIESMNEIIQCTEEEAYKYNRGHAPENIDDDFLADSICYNASNLASQSKSKAIIIFTYSGHTAFKVAGYRPDSKIYVFTSNKELIGKMSLLWAAKAFYFNKDFDILEAIDYSIEVLKQANEIESDDIVVHIGSFPLGEKGRTNMMKISYT
ncbi:MAG: pyruvate kinase [Bacteroidales bacterium]|nr:pyruvate kinase [Bacteroidales bacterium]